VQSRTLTKLVIYGARGFARELPQLIEDIAANGPSLTCLGFLFDRECHDNSFADLPMLGDADWLGGQQDVVVTIGVEATGSRQRIAHDIENRFGSRFLTLQHPRASVGKRVAIGAGSQVCAGVHLTTDIVIGCHVQLHVGCIVGHDAEIGDFATIAPGAIVSGRVRIGPGTFVGTGAIILTDVRVGDGVIVTAGAVVTKDVPDGVTVAGVPARIIAASALI
jgi:sugar O-acyltransferase (sialic acid O-acetyltransferase NeuD family)